MPPEDDDAAVDEAVDEVVEEVDDVDEVVELVELVVELVVDEDVLLDVDEDVVVVLDVTVVVLPPPEPPSPCGSPLPCCVAQAKSTVLGMIMHVARNNHLRIARSYRTSAQK